MISYEKKSIVRMEKDDLRKLVTQVQETLAADVDCTKLTKSQGFGAADLWNIQKRKKNINLRNNNL